MIRIEMALMVALVCGTARTMDFANLAKPDEVLIDGKPSDRVAVSADGAVTLAGGEAGFVTLVWNASFPKSAKVYGSTWERTYGNVAWRAVADRKKPNGGAFAWYVLVADGSRTDGYGVAVQPNAFATWRVEPGRLELSLDVRAGSRPVSLGSRRLEAARLVSRRGRSEENAFAAGRAFCRLMCPKSRLPKAPVYGYNDWYCAYGRNTATNFLADVAHFVRALDASGPCANRPFAVVDDGWQICEYRGWHPGADGEWIGHNETWGMPMDRLAAEVKRLGARPGLWYRPLHAWSAMPDAWRLRDRNGKALKSIDPTAPGLGEKIERDLVRFRGWGCELVKIDFITIDWNGRSGGARVLGENEIWGDRSRTSAEVILGLYRRMRSAAGDMVIIGCNAIDHFAAGLFELQRTGQDVCGFGWGMTRADGVNTLGLRALQNNIFYQGDPDCVCLAGEGYVPWGLNRQWLDAIARSGTALFVSWPRALAPEGGEALRAIAGAWRSAASAVETAEPLDWQEGLLPRRWRFADGTTTEYDWRLKVDEDAVCGTAPREPPEGRRTIRLASGDCTAEVDWTGRVVLTRGGRPAGTAVPIVEVKGRRRARPCVWEFLRRGDAVVCRNDYDGGLKVIFEIRLAPSGELKVRQSCAMSNGWGSVPGRVGVDFGGERTKPVRVGRWERPVLDWSL